MRRHDHGRLVIAGALAAALCALGCESKFAASSTQSAPSSAARQTSNPSQPAPADPDLAAGSWVRAAGDFANTRYSPLTEITPGNASGLKVAWTFSTGQVRGHEA